MRQILGQLHELRTTRDENIALKDYIAKDAEFDAREKDIAEQRIALMAERLAITEQRVEMERERGNLYEQLYRAVTAKPSIGCQIARVVTLGIHRCR